MISSEERRQRRSVFITTTCIVAFSVAIGYVGVIQPKIDLWWAIPTLFTICFVGLRIGYPRIPKLQALAAFVCAYFVHQLPELLDFLPLHVIVELLIEFVLSGLFGRYWVRKGYIPPEANE